MQLAASISGSVVDPGGQRINAFVDAYNPDGTIASLGGASSGGFTINDLAAGSYLLYATALDAPLAGFYTDPLGGGPLLVKSRAASSAKSSPRTCRSLRPRAARAPAA
jgi:hypothetical protein